MEPFIVTVEYEGDPESNPKIPNTHDGHEFTYVIEGRLRLIVNGHKYDLNEGMLPTLIRHFPLNVCFGWQKSKIYICNNQ